MDDWQREIEEARALRAEAKQDLSDMHSQAPYVARLATRLMHRRAMNHFGDSIEITFKRKNHD